MADDEPSDVYTAAVIGAGSGGLTVAIGLAGFGHRVALIEGDRVGGDCTNVGCIPSKSLLHAARSGLDDPLTWVRNRRDRLGERERQEMIDDPHITLIEGWASLTDRRDPHVVTVDTGEGSIEVSARHVVISAGSQPNVIAIDGLAPERTLTNENVFDLETAPDTIVFVGGGPVSIELAIAFRDMGSTVHIVEVTDRLLGAEDPLVSDTIRTALLDLGIDVHLGTSIERFEAESATAVLADGTAIGDVDRVMIAVGRRPKLARLGLEAAGVEATERGVVTDDWGRTGVDGIWALGDVTGNTATTHGANAMGRRTVRGIAWPRIPKIGTVRSIPNATFSRPEVASVGLSLDELDALPEVGRRRYRVDLRDLDRGYTDDVRHGFVIVDVERFTGEVHRATIVGPSAAELIGQFTMMIDHGIGLRKMFGTIQPYPAYADAIRVITEQFALDTFSALGREWWAMRRGRMRQLFGR